MNHLHKSISCLLRCRSTEINLTNFISIGVLGAPFWNGQPKPGTESGPDTLRAHGLISKLSQINKQIVDFGNLSFDFTPNDLIDSSVKLVNRNEFIFWKMCSLLSKTVQQTIDNGFLPVTLGGDHSVAVGSVLGTCHADKYCNEDISLIWIDAHADVNTLNTSVSGNLHGMPVSFLLNEQQLPQSNLMQRIAKSRLKASNIVYIGLRDVEMQELTLMKELNIPYFSMQHIDQLGIDEVMARAIDIANPSGKSRLHVSFDVDSVDNSMVVSTGTSVLGGLTIREAIRVAEIIYDTNQMVALDVVEFNPKIGTQEQVTRSANYIIDIVLAFMGKSRLGCYHRRFE